MSPLTRTIVVGCALGLTVGCPGRGHHEGAAAWTPGPAPDLGPVVALVGTTPIHAAQVAAQAARSARPPREALDQLVRFHLLAERAREKLPGALPPAAPDRLVQRLLERDFEPVSRPEHIPEAELRAAYERVKRHFVHPRRVELGLLSVLVDAKASAEQRARADDLARQLKERLASRPPRNIDEVEAVASEPVFAAAKLRYVKFWQGEDGPFTGKAGAAMQRLQRTGDRTPMLEDATGHHVAWFVREDAARNQAFEAVREEVREKFHETWRKQQFATLTGRVAGAYRIETFPDRVQRQRPGPSSSR